MVNQEVRGSRGILTAGDREFLTDESGQAELTPSAVSHRWTNIRNRVYNSMYDFRYLNQLDSETLERALVQGEDLGAVTELPAAFQFLSHVQDLEDEQIYPSLERQPAFADFVEAAEKGLERDIAERKGSIAEVTVTVEVESLQPPEAAMRQLEEGENSASEELWLATLLQHTGVRREELSAIGPEDVEEEQ